MRRVILLLLSVSGSLCGAVFHVDRDVSGGIGDGSSWTNAFGELQSALLVARAGDEVWIAEGVYYPDEGPLQAPDSASSRFEPDAGVELYGGFSGTETMRSQRDVYRYRTVLSGDLQQDDFDPDGDGITARAADIVGINAAGVVRLSRTYGGGRLDGLVITGGNGTAAGGLYSLVSDLVVARCEFHGNRSTNAGGFYLTGQNVTMVNCTSSGNRATRYGGGGVTNGDLVLAGCLFMANDSSTAGGGLYIGSSASLTATHCTFVGNRSAQGGAILNVSRFGTPTFRNSIIWNNEASGSTATPSATHSAGSSSRTGFSHCLLANSGGSSAWVLPLTLNLGGNVDADPQFVDLPAVGEIPALGFEVLRLTAVSPGIDTGSNSSIEADRADLDGDGITGEPQPLDLGGAERLQNGTTDMGCYEGSRGPSVVAPVPLIEFAPGSGLHPGLVDLSTVFDETAVEFAIESVTPPGRVEGTVDPVTGLMDLTVLPGAVGEVTITARATDADGAAAFTTILVAIFPPVLYVDAAATGAGTGLSWADAIPHLQDALDLGGSSHEIWIAEGTYRPDLGGGRTVGDASAKFVLPAGVSLRGGFVSGSTDPASRLPEARSILSGDVDANDLDADGDGLAADITEVVGENSDLLLEASAAPAGVVLEHLTFSAAGGSTNGGGLRATNSQMILRRCDFIANQATQGAGAHLSGGDIVIEDCTFQENVSVQDGGGLRLIGTSTTMDDCVFEGNRSSTGGGGVAASDSTIELSGCEFLRNLASTSSDRGGAVWLRSSPLSARDCRFTGNATPGTFGYGGAIFGSLGSIDLLRCDFEGNQAYDGGALYLDGGTTTRIVQARMIGNSSSSDGGAIYLDGAELSVSASEFRGNAGTDGGAVYNEAAAPGFHGCTFSGNDAAGTGGAIYNRTQNSATPAASELTHCIVWNNRSWGETGTARASVGDSSTGHESSFAHCLIANSGGSAAWNPDLGHDLGGNLALDPQFLLPVDPASAPTSLGDLRLPSTSPAIDSGDNALLPADELDADGDLDLAEPLPQDLGGLPRIAGAAPDMGAHEAEPGPASVGSLPRPRLEPLSGSHPALIQLADFFDGTAVGFLLDAVFPADIVTASVHPTTGQLDLGVLPDRFGPVSVIVGATNAAGATSFRTLQIDVFPSVVHVDAAATGLATGLTWDDAFPDLQSALQVPRIGLIPLDVWIAEGQYRPDQGPGQVADNPGAVFSVPARTNLYGGFAGNETSRDSRNPDLHPTILSGDLGQDDIVIDGRTADAADQRGVNSNRILYVPPLTPIIIDGVTITGASGGSGIDASVPQLTLRDCRFAGNRGNGGGALKLEGGSVVVEASRFEGNLAASLSSSAIRDGGAIEALNVQLSIEGCVFAGNRTGPDSDPNGSGGAILADGQSLELVDTRFDGNRSASGGGAIKASDLDLRIEGCTFSGNECSSSGGALMISNCPTELCRSAFTGNRGTNGGAVNFTGPSFVAVNVEFLGNSASNEGGALSLSGPDLRVRNAIFAGNFSARDGGAVSQGNYPANYSHCTFTGNRAIRRGGAFYYPFTSNPVAPGFHNSIFAANMAGQSLLLPVATVATQADYTQLKITFSSCLVEGSGGSGNWNPGFGLDGGGNLDANPSFLIPVSPLEAPTQAGDFRPGPHSPVIDAGNAALLPDDDCDLDGDQVTAEPLPLDLGGLARLVGAQPDLGAHETQTGPAAVGPQPRLDLDPESGDVTGALSVADLFDGSAVAFSLDSLVPANPLGVQVDPATGRLDVSVPPGTLGHFVAIVRATKASGEWTLRAVVIDVFPEVLFVDRAATGAGTGLSWADAIPHLQDALALGGSGYQVWMAAGVHAPDEGAGHTPDDPSAFFRLGEGVEIHGGFPAGATSMAERDPIRWRTVLSGDLGGDDVDPDGDGVITDPGDQRGTNALQVVVAGGLSAVARLDGVWITGGNGGGMLVTAATPTLRGCRFVGNRGYSGGALVVVASAPLVVEGCEFDGNSSTQYGGAVYASASEVEFRACSFRGNRSTWGGALADTDGHLSLVSSTCSGNAAERGGAIYVAGLGATLHNCLLHGNQADIGGAIENAADTLEAIHCTFTENTAWEQGGAVSNTDYPDENQATYTNCILWNNQHRLRQDSPSASSSTYDGTVPDTLFTACIIANSGGSAAWNPAIGTDGGGNLDVDPGFVAAGTPGVPLAGGSGFQPRGGSPAIDAGAATVLSSDLAGHPRSQGAAPDLGCFERPPVGPAVVTPSTRVELAPHSGAHPAAVQAATLFDESAVAFEIESMEPAGIVQPNLDPATGTLGLEVLSDRFGRVQLGIAAIDAGGGRSLASLVVDVIPERVFVNNTATGTGSGLSWANAFPSLQSALDQLVTGYEIWVAEGTYYPFDGPGVRYHSDDASFKLRSGLQVFGGFAGNETTRSARDPGHRTTLLQGYTTDVAQPRIFLVVTAVGVGSDCTLDGFTVAGGIGGSATGGINVRNGGALHLDGSSPLITGCRFMDSYARYSGGAGAWIGNGSMPFFESCEFIACQSFSSWGGAVLASDGSAPVFENCLWQGNSAFLGGALGVRSGATVRVINGTFSGNSARSDGGAVWSEGALFLGNSIVWNNRCRTDSAPSTAIPSASLFQTASGTTDHRHNLVAHSGGSAAWNPDLGTDLGGNLDADPAFLIPADPANFLAPPGDLRLGFGSAALDFGDNQLVTTAVDLDGVPRITNATVDLGAYEGQNDQLDSDGDQLSDAFEMAFTTPSSRTALMAGNDDDGDGLTNLEEFFFGLDPRVSDAGRAASLAFEQSGSLTYLAIRYRVNPWARSFLQAEVQRSTDLGGDDDWSTGETTRVGVERLSPNLEQITERSKRRVGLDDAEFLRVRTVAEP